MLSSYPIVRVGFTDNKGRGIFACRDIKKDEVIECTPVIIIPSEQVEFIKKTKLFEYYFLWGDENNEAAIALGFGSLYNHSFKPNAKYIKKFEDQFIEFVALKDIKKDEEILINYLSYVGHDHALWFEVTE